MNTISDENKKLKILYVDDTKINLKIFSCLIGDVYPDIELFLDPIDAVQSINERHFDIIFTDQWMPNLTGEEVLEKIKLSAKNKDTPTIIFTSDFREELRNKYMSEGFCGYLPKPVSREIVINMISEVTDGKNDFSHR